MPGRRWAGRRSTAPISFTAQLQGVVSGDPVQERYVGGGYCAIDYSREEPAPSWAGA